MGRKVETVRSDTDGAPPPTFGSVDCSLGLFQPSSEEDIRTIIQSAPAKSCDLDPAPNFLHQGLPRLFPALHHQDVQRLTEEKLPTFLQKRAMITPRIKKPGLDRDDINNFRPYLQSYIYVESHGEDCRQATDCLSGS